MTGQLASCKPAPETHEAVTLLFSDIVGSTAMTLSLGDLEAHRVMERHNAIVRTALTRWGGSEIEVQGDGFLLAFGSARRGVGCAVAIQRAMASFRHENPENLRIRIGVHSGSAMPVDGRYFGADVILSARISMAAGTDEILVSERTAREAQLASARTGMPRLERLKGFEAPQAVIPVKWEASTRPASHIPNPVGSEPRPAMMPA